MDPVARKELNEIRALLRVTATQSKESYEKAMVRMDKFDKKLEATRKLVEFGMKMLVRLERSQKATDGQIKATDAQLKALISFRSGGNGQTHN